MKYIICDLDGTLFNGRDGDDWYDREFEHDIVVPEVRELLSRYNRCGIIFITTRWEKYRVNTLEALYKTGFDVQNNSGLMLFMRSNTDKRPDDVIKKEVYKKEIEDKYQIKFVIEDRPRVVRMWRKLGLFVFEVNQANEDF